MESRTAHRESVQKALVYVRRLEDQKTAGVSRQSIACFSQTVLSVSEAEVQMGLLCVCMYVGSCMCEGTHACVCMHVEAIGQPTMTSLGNLL